MRGTAEWRRRGFNITYNQFNGDNIWEWSAEQKFIRSRADHESYLRNASQSWTSLGVVLGDEKPELRKLREMIVLEP